MTINDKNRYRLLLLTSFWSVILLLIIVAGSWFIAFNSTYREHELFGEQKRPLPAAVFVALSFAVFFYLKCFYREGLRRAITQRHFNFTLTLLFVSVCLGLFSFFFVFSALRRISEFIEKPPGTYDTSLNPVWGFLGAVLTVYLSQIILQYNNIFDSHNKSKKLFQKYILPEK